MSTRTCPLLYQHFLIFTLVWVKGSSVSPAAEAPTLKMSPGLPLSQAFPNPTSEARSDRAISPPTVIQDAISSVLGTGSSSLDCLPAFSFPNSIVHFYNPECIFKTVNVITSLPAYNSSKASPSFIA